MKYSEDWEMRARQLAEDLGALAFWLLGACIWLWLEVNGWMTVLPVLGAVIAVNAIASSEKIES